MIIPFFIPHAGCPHQCVFCDQRRISGSVQAPDPSSIPGTIRSYLGANRGEGAQVAFFGGTFTALPRELQLAYLDEVAPFRSSGSITSIRISTRPDAVSPDNLSLLKDRGVTIVELGVQSLDDEVLRLSGRGHAAEDTVRATDLLRAHGMSVGFQLMPGLPGDSLDRFRATVRRTVELRPDAVRLYPALVIGDTPLERMFRSGRYLPLSLDDAVSWCRDAVRAFREAGIAVLRVGLQAAESLRKPGTIVAGPFHPAFGQLVASALLLEAMRTVLEAPGNRSQAVLRVHPADLSAAIGQHRGNIRTLEQHFGRPVEVLADPQVTRGRILPG